VRRRPGCCPLMAARLLLSSSGGPDGGWCGRMCRFLRSCCSVGPHGTVDVSQQGEDNQEVQGMDSSRSQPKIMLMRCSCWAPTRPAALPKGYIGLFPAILSTAQLPGASAAPRVSLQQHKPCNPARQAVRSQALGDRGGRALSAGSIGGTAEDPPVPAAKSATPRSMKVRCALGPCSRRFDTLECNPMQATQRRGS
jgi:hypothetical protein